MIFGLKSTFINCMTCALVVIKTKTNFKMKPSHARQTTYFICNDPYQIIQVFNTFDQV